MAVFAVIPTTPPQSMPSIIRTKFAGKHLPVGNAWLIAYPGTSQQLTHELGLDGTGTELAIVIAAASYWGRASVDVWEWMKANWQESV